MSTSLAALVPYRGWRRSLLGLLTALALLVAFPAATRAATVSVTTTGVDATCARDSGSCATIAKAVEVAQSGDTIQFGTGNFAANTAQITKTLTFRGARAGVPISQRDPVQLAQETVLAATGNGLYVGAEGTVIDGLVFSGSDAYGLWTAGRVGGQRVGGYQIRNNIFTGNRTGIYLRDGLRTVVSGNLFEKNGLKPGENLAAIYGDDSANKVTFSGNEFRGNKLGLSLVPGVDEGGSDVEYIGNRSINDDQDMNFNGVVGLRIIDNTMDGGAAGISLVGDGLDEVLVEGNRITRKGSYGININTYGRPQNGKITIRENTILDTRAANGGAGMAITTAADSFSKPLTIVYNRIVDSAKIGLRNRETTEVAARRNWWGCNLGPGTQGCDSVVAEGGGVLPDFAPWLTLSLSLHDATSFTPSGEIISGPVEAGGSATLFARDANLSSGGLANGPFFREAPVTFASDPAGATLNPPTTTLSNNAVTATSAFTANLRPIEWSVTLDHQLVRLFNPDSPTTTTPGSPGPCVVPIVVPSDRTLTRRQRVVITIGLVNRCTQTARRLRVCMRTSAKLSRTGKRCRRIARLQPGHTVVLRLAARARRGACRGPLVNRVRLEVAGQRPLLRRAVMRLNARRCGPPPAVTGRSTR